MQLLVFCCPNVIIYHSSSTYLPTYLRIYHLSIMYLHLATIYLCLSSLCVYHLSMSSICLYLSIMYSDLSIYYLSTKLALYLSLTSVSTALLFRVPSGYRVTVVMPPSFSLVCVPVSSWLSRAWQFGGRLVRYFAACPHFGMLVCSFSHC